MPAVSLPDLAGSTPGDSRLVIFVAPSWRKSRGAVSGDLDDHLERPRVGRMAERLVGLQDPVELEAMRDQKRRVDLVRSDNVEQDRRAGRIDQPRGYRDIAVPQTLEMKSDLGAMHANVGDDAARGDDLLAQFECRRNTDRLDGSVDRKSTRLNSSHLGISYAVF